MEIQKMYTADEMAKILRISRATLSRLVRDNRIAHYRIGQRTMFDEDSLKNFREATFQSPVGGNREAA
jgi:excisionase family DNA binding protein